MRSVSQFENPNFTEKTMLLDVVSEDRVPQQGRVWVDKQVMSHPRNYRSRDYSPATFRFNEVNAWKIQDAVLSNGVYLHRDDDAFLDASLLMHATKGAVRDTMLARFTDNIKAADTYPIDYSYSDKSVLLINNEGGNTWGHFVVHNLPKALIYARHFPNGLILVPEEYFIENSPQRNFGKLLLVYGISETSLIKVSREVRYKFGEVVLLDFLYDFVNRGGIRPDALELLEIDCRASGQSSSIYLERSSSTREIANGSAVRQSLRQRGVDALRLGACSVTKQIETWRGSNLVATTLGSDLTNMIFAKPGAKILSLTPSFFVDNFFFKLATAKGVIWNEIECGEIAEHWKPERNSKFLVDIDLLEEAMDALI